MKKLELKNLPKNLDIRPSGQSGAPFAITGKAASVALGKPPKDLSAKQLAELENAYNSKTFRGGENYKDNLESYLNRKWLEFAERQGYKTPRKTAKRLAAFEKAEARNLQRAARRYEKQGKDTALEKDSDFRQLKRVKYKKAEQAPKAVSGGISGPSPIEKLRIDITPQQVIFLTAGGLDSVLAFLGLMAGRGQFLGYECVNSYKGQAPQNMGTDINNVKQWLIYNKNANSDLLPVWVARYVEMSNGNYKVLFDIVDYKKTGV